MASSGTKIHFCCVSHGEVILVTHQTEPENYVDVIRNILPLLPQVPGEKKLTFPAERFQIHVLADDDGLSYLCVTDPNDRNLLPFIFLDTIRTKFTGTASLIQDASRAHENEFEKDFAPVLAAVVFNFNRGQGDKISALETQVHDVKRIILNNVEKLIERGEKLDELVAKSENLTVTSVGFKQGARAILQQHKCKNWKMWLIICSLLGTILTIALLIAVGTIRL